MRATRPTELLQRQHEDTLAVFDELDLTEDELERVRLLVRAAEKLKAHAALEQDVFYPAVHAAAGERVDDAFAAHRAIDVLLDETVGTPTTANIKLLRHLIEEHFADEERTLFTLVEGLGDDAAASLAERLQDYARAVDEGPGARRRAEPVIHDPRAYGLHGVVIRRPRPA